MNNSSVCSDHRLRAAAMASVLSKINSKVVELSRSEGEHVKSVRRCSSFSTDTYVAFLWLAVTWTIYGISFWDSVLHQYMKVPYFMANLPSM